MPNRKAIQTVASLINLDFLPENLSFVQSGINTIFGRIYYKNLKKKSTNGEGFNISIELLFPGKAAVDLGGSGFELVLFPSMPIGSAPQMSQIDLELQFRMGILKYLRDFSPANFVEDAQNVLDTLIDDVLAFDDIKGFIEETYNGYYGLISNVDIEELISMLNGQYSLTGTGDEIIYVASPETTLAEIEAELTALSIDATQVASDFSASWASATPGSFTTEDVLFEIGAIEVFEALITLEEFAEEVNEAFSLTGTANEITFPLSSDPYQDIADALINEGKTIKDLVEHFVTDFTTDVAEIKAKVKDYFTSLSPIAQGENLADLFKPYIHAEIGNLAIALEFPRSILNPIDPDTGEHFTDPDVKSRVTADVGTLIFDSQSGVDFESAVNINFHKSEIGTTGFIIEVVDLKLDTRDDKNIPEIDALGYSPEFKGIYIGEASITLPDYLTSFADTNNVSIYGRDVAIDVASGQGFSGTVGVDTGTNPLTFTFGNGLILTIEDFSITFHQNQVQTPVTLTAGIEIPQFTVEDPGTGQQVPFSVEADLTIYDDGFKVVASIPTPLLNNDKVRIELSELTIGSQAAIWQFGFKGEFENKIKIPVVSKIFPNELLVHNFLFYTDGNIEFDIQAIWESGISIRGDQDNGLTYYIPFNKKIAEIFELDGVDLNVKVQNNKFGAGLALRGASIKMSEVVTGTIDGLGFDIVVKPDENNGNMGPFDIGLEVVPPKGIGVSVDAKAVKGEGYLYLDYEAGEYIGALGLTIKEVVQVNAIALINTKMPDGSKGFSMLVIITAEFTPIQLGFGFTLNGVGGLLGLHRTAKFEFIRANLKESKLDSILFPQDIVDNITTIISDIKEIFPIRRKAFVLGPMGKFGWGSPTLINIDIGLFIEFGGGEAPKIAILGKISLALPTEEFKLLNINVAFIGIIDFENKYISFDASIYDSKLLAFTLAGDMALRIFWGNRKEFVISVGGFHPAFSPAADLALGNMERLSISLLGDNPRLTIETYFAVTSNSVQLGAKAEFEFKAWKIRVWGYLGFDVLFEFDPFFFSVDIYAGLGVYMGNTEILGVHLAFTLSGPTPWRAKGKAKIKILFIKIPIKFDITWGDKKDTSLPNINVLPQVKEAFETIGNWRTTNGGLPELDVSLRKLELAPETLYVQPNGSFEVSQKIVPLGQEITRFGNQLPVDYTRFEISYIGFRGGPALNRTDLEESFAPAQYSQAEFENRLKAPSFVDMKSGVKAKVGSDERKSGAYLIKEVTYEEIRIDYDDVNDELEISIPVLEVAPNNFDMFYRFVESGAIGKSFGSKAVKKQQEEKEALVSVNQECFRIINNTNLQSTGGNQLFNSEEEARAAMDARIRNNPDLEDLLLVVPEFDQIIL